MTRLVSMTIYNTGSGFISYEKSDIDLDEAMEILKRYKDVER